MAQATRTFRIFVSSTFSDLKAERNALQKHVFPRLRDLCARHGCRFQAIDLRWGVREEAAIDQQTMRICLEEIARCKRVTPKPNFIALLGDRFGWRPLPFAIPADEFAEIEQRVADLDDKALAHRWYKRDDNAVPPVYDLQPRGGDFRELVNWEPVERRLLAILAAATADFEPDKRLKYFASATAQEIVLGAMDGAASQREHLFGFFREIKNIPHDRSARDFIDLDQHGDLDTAARSQLRKLKDRLTGLLPGNIHDYDATWQNGVPTTDHIGALPSDLDACLLLNEQADAPRTLCVDVWRRLSRAMLDQVALIEAVDPLDKEVGDHAAFGRERAEHFVGRTAILNAIGNYLAGTDNHPLVVYGPSGSGKTALIAEAIARCQSRGPKGAVVCRFVGATPNSSNSGRLLHDLCRQVSRLYGAHDADVPAEYQQLVREFPKRLCLATAEEPLLLFLDALDQLAESEPARTLAWLPAELPAHVRLVVSTLPGDCLSAFERQLPKSNLLELGSMLLEDGRDLLDRWLRDTGRTLQPTQRAEVLGKFSAVGLPLYLKLAFEDVRHWKSDANPRDTVLPTSVAGVIQDLFGRLIKDHGSIMVQRALGYLCAARRGLSEDEMLDVLSIDTDVFTDFRERAQHEPPEQRLPVVMWSRLYDDLKPYLTERDAHGAPVLSFYHRQLEDAARATFLARDRRSEAHSHLAAYFGDQGYFRETLKAQQTRRAAVPPILRPVNARKVDELPWQLCEAERVEEVEALFTDLFFLEAKAEAGLVSDLISELSRSLEIIPGGRARREILVLLEEAVRRSLPFIRRHPTTLFQSLWNFCWWYESGSNRNGATDAPVESLTVTGSIAALMEEWRVARHRHGLARPWLRDALPPQFGLGAGETQTLTREQRKFSHVAHAPFGRYVAAGSKDGKVMVWNAADGRLLWSQVVSDREISALVFSGDGRTLAVAYDSTVALHDGGGGAQSGAVDVVGSVVALAWTSDRSLSIVVESWSHLTRHTAIVTWEAPSSRITCDRDLGSERVLAIGVRDARVAIVATNKGFIRFDGEPGSFEFEAPCSVATVDGDVQLVATGDDDGIIRVVDVRTRATTRLAGHESRITRVQFLAPGSLVSASWDGTVRLWDVKTATERRCLRGHEWFVTDVCADGLRRTLFTCSWDGSVRAWKIAAGRDRGSDAHNEGWIVSLAFSAAGDILASGCIKGTILLCDLASGGRRVVRTPGDWLSNVGFSSDGSEAVAVFPACGSYRWWQVADGREVRSIDCGGPLRASFFAFSSARQRAALSHGATRIIVIDMIENDWRHHATIHHDGGPNRFGFSPDGGWLALSSTYGAVCLWNADTGELVRTLGTLRADVAAVAFVADTSDVLAMTGERDGRSEVGVWDARTGHELDRFDVQCPREDYSPDVQAVVFDADGRTVTARSVDGSKYVVLADGIAHIVRLGDPKAWFSWIPLVGDSESVVESTSTGGAVAWYPKVLDNLLMHPTRAMFAGSIGNQLHLLELVDP